MGNDYFSIDKCQICLYGCNKNAINMNRNLKKAGLTVKYIIDKRAGDVNEAKLVDLASFERMLRNDEEQWCIIICLQNGRIHDEIAMQFHQMGIDNLIYIPMREGYNRYALNEIRQCYMEVFYGSVQPNKAIPTYQKLNEDKDIVKIVGENIVLYVPVELVYVGKPEFADLNGVKGQGLKKFFDKRIAELKFYNDLYEYVFKKGKYPKEYVRNCTRNKNEDEYIKDRIDLYRLMKHKVYDDPYFFLYSPASAQWNENGYFNLIDGHHRVNFLYNVGYKKIPIIVNKSDYDLYKQYYCIT